MNDTLVVAVKEMRMIKEKKKNLGNKRTFILFFASFQPFPFDSFSWFTNVRARPVLGKNYMK